MIRRNVFILGQKKQNSKIKALDKNLRKIKRQIKAKINILIFEDAPSCIAEYIQHRPDIVYIDTTNSDYSFFDKTITKINPNQKIVLIGDCFMNCEECKNRILLKDPSIELVASSLIMYPCDKNRWYRIIQSIIPYYVNNYSDVRYCEKNLQIEILNENIDLCLEIRNRLHKEQIKFIAVSMCKLKLTY